MDLPHIARGQNIKTSPRGGLSENDLPHLQMGDRLGRKAASFRLDSGGQPGRAPRRLFLPAQAPSKHSQDFFQGRAEHQAGCKGLGSVVVNLTRNQAGDEQEDGMKGMSLGPCPASPPLPPMQSEQEGEKWWGLGGGAWWDT